MEELNIPQEYITRTKRNLLVAAVHKSWLKLLTKTHHVPDFVYHESLSVDEVRVWLHQGEDLGPAWQKVIIKTLVKKPVKVIPPPRCRSLTQVEPEQLSFAHLLHYISQTNHKNLWKDSYKKFSNTSPLADKKQGPNIVLANFDVVMRDLINRTFGCPVINIESTTTESLSDSKIRYEVHSNILPALCAIESKNNFFVIHPYTDFSLQDCVTFSPAVLTTSHSKPLFIIYQVIQAMRSMHDRGLVLGDLALCDILVSQNLWIQIIPRLEDNIHNIPCTDSMISSPQNRPKQEKLVTTQSSPVLSNVHHIDYKASVVDRNGSLKPSIDNIFESRGMKSVDGLDSNLARLCDMWVRGNLTNFEYIFALNECAGRRYGDPTSHYVMPWVTDFTLQTGGNWRDLSKSKFRINKGDRQLDLTYDAAAATSQVPHHVSDVLSEITYYVYMARRTPKSVLCKYVRTKWVPAEYPISIQRLQEWTPDECIPEFFTDPTVFKSIHPDLGDLQLPSWVKSPEDFIEKHREILESSHISERLHQWIDLTFGYKLSGSAAIKAKNLCLHLVDNHVSLRKTGVVQLFTQPHPQRAMPSPFWGKTPPKINLHRKIKGERGSDDEGHSSGFEEEEITSTSSQAPVKTASLPLTRLLSRSRGSLLGPLSSASDDSSKDKSDQKGSNVTTIPLPKDFNPVAALVAIESLYNFTGKTFHHNLTNEKPEVNASSIYRQVVAGRRIREMQVLGCLVVELFLASKLRAVSSYNSSSFEERQNACYAILARSADSLPRCVKYAVALLLQFDLQSSESDSIDESRYREIQKSFRYPTVTSQGLPPPSAHQLLQPLLSSSVFPFPNQFVRMYSLLASLHDYSSASCELDLVWPRDADTEVKTSFIRSKIAESKVSLASKELIVLLPEMLAFSPESLDIILSYVQEMLEDPFTSILAAWELFDPMSRVLGPQKSTASLLDSILKLYDYDASENKAMAEKHGKIYHRSFILKLIVRFGLKVFLENFITPLVEAVGGYKDSYDYQRAEPRSKASHLNACDLEDNVQECDGVLSPLDEDSSADSDQKVDKDEEKKKDEEETDVEIEPEVFVFENEPEAETEETKNSPTEEAPLYNLMDHLDLLPQNEPEDSSSVEFQVEGEEMEDPPAQSSSPDTKPVSKPSVRVYDTNPDKRLDDLGFTRGQMATQKDDKLRKLSTQCKVSDMSVDSLVWLSHRLGPVLTARHLSRNLLRMLTLCYLGKENLTSVRGSESEPFNSSSLSVSNGRVVGDDNATKVLDCLASFAALYGEHIILLQYFPHMSELMALCKKKLSANLEGGLVGCLALLKHIVPYLCDATLMDQLQDVIMKTILNPVVRIVSTTRFCFPSGSVARSAVAAKFLDAIYVLSLRIGCEMTRTHLTVPLLQRFFLTFDKAFEREDSSISLQSRRDSPMRSLEESSFLEIRRDGSVAEWAVKGIPVQISHVRESADSYSPPPLVGSAGEQVHELARAKAVAELKHVFCPELAHTAYLLFYRFLGDGVMEQSLKNHEFIQNLCYEYESEMQQSNPNKGPVEMFYLSDYLVPADAEAELDRGGSGSFGSNVAVVGNRIDLQRVDLPSVQPPQVGSPASGDIMTLITRKMENTNRHLHGNWLAYWEHEIGRAEKDTRFNFKQIKLQTFAGHSNSVKSIQALDNENSFISGSRDKTVKLWSLRSQGDGAAVSHCQWTYSGHRKSVLAISFLESLRLAVSCDSGVHIWDPFMGCVVAQLPANPPVNVVKVMSPPSTSILAATTDSTLKIIDARTCSFVNELKVSLNPVGLIRCVAIAPSGHWVAVGQSSGFLTILDIRTGMIVSSWKGHEGEVLQLVATSENTIVSSSLDQAVSVWSSLDGKLNFHMKGPTEPVHCLAGYGSELISGTTANRIGVHTAVSAHASFSSTRLRSDAFKGVLTAMSVLPLNRFLLLGADSGNISLLC